MKKRIICKVIFILLKSIQTDGRAYDVLSVAIIEGKRYRVFWIIKEVKESPGCTGEENMA